MCKHFFKTLPAPLTLALVVATALPGDLIAQPDEPVTTVMLVRHSEKEGQGRDPLLSVAGKERARALAHVLGEMNVKTIYATQFARTQHTAQPLADHLGLPVTVVNAAAGYTKEIAQLIRTKHRGDIVVVVSHSNTVPEIIAALGATPVPVIDENEYDDLYVVTLFSGGAHVLNLRYGRESP